MRLRLGWRSDVASVVVALAFAALLLSIGDASASSTPPWRADAAIGAAACLALWWRRRWPLGLAVALVPIAAVSATTTAPMAVALFTLAANRPARTALPVAAASWAGVTVYFELQNDPSFPLWVDLLVRGCIIIAAVGWGRYARAHRDLVASLHQRAAELEAEQQRRVNQARLAERTRIAREMHDVLAHRLSLVSLHAGALEIRTDARPDEVASAAGVIRANAHEALTDLRMVIGVLRDAKNLDTDTAPERPQPDLRDVPSLTADVEAAGTPVNYRCDTNGATPPTATGRAIYRIVEEALTNVGKHAPGMPAQVHIDGRPAAGVHVRISNPLSTDTVPTPRPPGARVGLVGLAERVSLAGGWLRHGLDSEQFQVEAWLPWPG